MRNPIYSGDPKEWESLTLPEQLEYIRKDMCTGPCGQSSSVMTRRSRIDKTLRTAIEALK